MGNSNNEKLLERYLLVAVIGSSVSALIMFVCSAWAYFHKHDFVIEKTSVPIDMYNSLVDLMLVLAIQVTFWVGIVFFCIGYVVWKAYWKHKQIRVTH
jgi:hypothetical protein